MSEDNDILVDIANIPDDVSWLRASFLMSDEGFDATIKQARNYTTADNKFQNTSLGGNYAVNIPPQFTHTADPNLVGHGSGIDPESLNATLPRFSDDVGMGMFFSEAIDDNKEVIHMRFGVPEYSSLATFFLNSYDVDLAKLAKTGEASKSFIGYLGSAIGSLAGFVAAIPIGTFVGAIRLGNFAAKIIFNSGFYLPATRYYYIKPTMRLYWKAVNYMTNALAVNLGILPGYIWEGSFETLENNKFSFFSSDAEVNKASLTPRIVEEMHKALPDIFRKEGGIDVRSVANKAKRLEISRRKKLTEIMENFEKTEDMMGLNEDLEKLLREKETVGITEEDADPELWFMNYLNSKLSEETKNDDLDNAIKNAVENEEGTIPESLSIAEKSVGSWLFDNGSDGDRSSNEMSSYLEAELYSGSDWVTFRVTGEKTVSESFLNETGQSAIAEKINNMAGSVRDAKFNFAGGDIGIPGLQSVIDFVTSTSNAAVGTFAKYTGMDGLGVLLGGGFVDIPHTWKNSTANLPKMEYKIELRATYGNKISIFTDIYVPLMMLLAASLPLSTGRQSYTSPFLVEVYRKGRSQIKMGIVENISITRGVGNSGWSVDQLPLGIDVSINIADLTTIMHMPIDDRLGGYDDNNAYSDYMATLGSLGLMDITLWQNVLQRAKAKFNYDWSTSLFNSRSSMASLLGDVGVNVFGTNFSIRSLLRTIDDSDLFGRQS